MFSADKSTTYLQYFLCDDKPGIALFLVAGLGIFRRWNFGRGLVFGSAIPERFPLHDFHVYPFEFCVPSQLFLDLGDISLFAGLGKSKTRKARRERIEKAQGISCLRRRPSQHRPMGTPFALVFDQFPLPDGDIALSFLLLRPLLSGIFPFPFSTF